MKKGFASLELVVGLGILLTLVFLFIGYKFRNTGPSLGAVVYTTQLSDTLGTFRNQVNSSTANLNTQLVAVSSSVSTLNTLTNLLPIANGGTNTTTIPANNVFMMGNGTGYAFRTLSSSTGITLTYTATTTIIGTAGFDSTANIAFTGNNTFANSSTFNGLVNLNATTTVTGATTFKNAPTINTWGTSPSSTATFGQLGLYYVATSTINTINTISGNVTTTATTTFPAMGPSDTLVIESIHYNQAGDNNQTSTITVNGATLCTFPVNNNWALWNERLTVKNLGSTSLQWYKCEFATSTTMTGLAPATTSLSLGSTFTASSTILDNGGGNQVSYQFAGYYIKD